MTRSVRAFAQKAIWMLPVWAALLGLSTLTHQPDPQTAFADFAAYITTPQFLIAHLVASIAGAAIGSIGVIGLMLYLQDSPAVGRAITGMVATVAGNTLTTAVFGAAAFAQPAMGRMFQAGHTNAQEFYNQVYAVPLFITVILGLLLMMAGGVWAGMAITSSGRFPRWTGWVYALAVTGFVVSGFLFSAVQSLMAGILTLATLVIAWRAGHAAPQPHTATGLSQEV